MVKLSTSISVCPRNTTTAGNGRMQQYRTQKESGPVKTKKWGTKDEHKKVGYQLERVKARVSTALQTKNTHTYKM
jgi:hypothetical protein